MQLLRLRRRLELARRGHKLLKDKLDGLMQRFFGIKNDYLDLYKKVEPEMIRVFSKAVFSSALSSSLAFSERTEVSLETTVQNIMGVSIPNYRVSTSGKAVYNPLQATSELGEALSGFSLLLPDMVRLASLSRALQLIAAQIIETRRRVNALEYVLIPELKKNVNMIRMKLSEMERSSIVSLMKIKDIVRGR